MLFMVVEKFRDQNAKAVYQRLSEKGRMMPEGLTYIDSWVSADLDQCFQLMEADDLTQLQQWISHWTDLVSFQIVPVVHGKDTAAAIATS